MLTPAQREKIVAILDAADDLTIATNRSDGFPQATTVSFVNDGTAIYFGTWSQSQKAKNIARDDRVSIAITDPYESWNDIKGVSIGGRARKLSDPAERAKVGAIMMKKFPQIAEFAQVMQENDMALFRIDADVISILDYSKGFGTTEFCDAR
jgi:nitroimidazol reductase NimA-like FMN-containing flavoprotein (pyridoxamine 5'-phosphate oxidase superfamily)